MSYSAFPRVADKRGSRGGRVGIPVRQDRLLTVVRGGQDPALRILEVKLRHQIDRNYSFLGKNSLPLVGNPTSDFEAEAIFTQEFIKGDMLKELMQESPSQTMPNFYDVGTYIELIL
ncbi:hypothetical protein J5N97_020282 [Dioscorea zingiberensis]|uniref:Uncharacterized protein n=1 Tax=Dioscorea zingiberensis TaxID=325984 RepID=A0A9D5CGS6_9LILI|nr:hypothetical protein J5N97_020282 [Dioscorea zingiberensis]